MIIDNKVVEMRFDNKDFEKNVKTSMGTLDKLKKSLKMDNEKKSFGDLDKAIQNINLGRIADSVEALQKRFSTFGIVGMRVIENLTDATMRFINNTWSKMTSTIVEGGKRRATNIENAKFQLQGLLNDEKKVQAIMDDAMFAVDGTAYGFDEAANAASQFAASGVEAGDQMKSALKAITGVAAMTNSQFSDIANIFTTVSGNGRLMGDQLNQLASRGMNAASTITKYFNGVNDGSIQVADNIKAQVQSISKSTSLTEQEIRDFVSKGKINFEIFASAMDSSFGEHAKKANETLNGAISNMKSSLGRIGAEFIQPLIKQNGPLVQMFNSLRIMFNNFKAQIVPFAKIVTDFATKVIGRVTKMVDNLAAKIKKADFAGFLTATKNILIGLDVVFHGLKQRLIPLFEAVSEYLPSFETFVNLTEKFKSWSFNIFPTKNEIEGFTNGFKNVLKNLAFSEKTMKNLKDAFKGIFAVLDIIKQVISALAGPASKVLGTMLRTIIGIAGAIGRWMVALDEYFKRNDTFNRIVDGTIKVLKVLGQAFKNVYDWVDAFVKRMSGKSLSDIFKSIKSSIKGMFEGLGEFFNGNAITNVFETIADKIASAFGVIRDSIGGFKDIDTSGPQTFADKLKKIFGPLGTLFDFIKGVFVGLWNFLKSLWPSISKIFHDIGEMLGKIKDKILQLLADADSNDILNYIKSGSLMIVASKLSKFLKALTNSTKANAKTVGGLKSIITSLNTVVTSIKGVLDGVKSTLVTFQKDIKANIILKIAIAVAILTAALVALSGIDKDKLQGALGVITTEFIELIATMKIMTTGKASANSITAIGTMLLMLSTSVLIMASAMKKVASIDDKKLKSGIGGITVLISELVIAMKILGSNKKSTETGVKGLLSMAAAVYVLSMAVKKLSKIDSDSLLTGLLALTAILAALTAFVKITSGSSLSKVGAGLIFVAVAVKMFASIIKKLGKLGLEQVAVGLLGFAGIMTIITASMMVLKKDAKGIVKVASALIVFGIAMTIIAAAFKIFASGNLDKTTNGIVAFSSTLAVIIVAFKALQTDTKGIAKIASALIIFGTAMTIIAAAFKIFVSNDIEHLATGLIGFAGAMTIIVESLSALVLLNRNNTGLVKVSATLMIIATGMVIIASAIKKMGSIGIENVAVGLIGFAGAMVIIIYAIKSLAETNLAALSDISFSLFVFADAMTYIADALVAIGQLNPVQMVVGLVGFAGAMMVVVSALQALEDIQNMMGLASGMLVLSLALVVLATAMKIFGSMSLIAMIGSLVMLAGVFVTLALAAKLLKPTVSTLLSLAKSLILLGVGVLGLGAGLFLISVSLVTLAASGGAALLALVSMVKGFIGLLPYFGEAFMDMIKVILGKLALLLPDIWAVITETLKGLIKMLGEIVPQLAETLFEIIYGILEAFSRYAPKIISIILDFIITLIKMLGNYAMKIADALVKTIFQILAAVGKALRNNIELIRDTIFGLIVDVLASALKLVAPWLVEWITGNVEVKESIRVLTEEQQANIDKSYEMAEAYRNLRDARNESLSGIDSEYSYIKNLRDEYNSYVDSNGNIIAGYEDRANVIITTLADAMGKEVEDIQGLIDANGKLGESFDQLMIKMQAEAYLEANKEAYTEAIKNQKEVQAQYAQSGHLLNELKDQLADADNRYAAIMSTYENTLAQGHEEAAQRYIESNQEFFAYHDELKNKVGEAQLAYGQAQMAYSGVMQEISNTQKLMAAASSGSVEEMKKAMDDLQNSFITAGNGTRETLIQQVSAYKSFYIDLKNALEDGMDGVTQADVEAAQKRLGRAEGELAKYEAAHEKSGEQADKKLAKSIEKNTDVVVKSEKKVMDDTVKTAEDEADDIVPVGKYIDQGLANGISDYSYLPENAMGDTVKKTINKGKEVAGVHSPSKVFAEIGKNLDLGLINGIKSLQSGVETAGEGLGESAINGMNETIAKMYDYLDSNMDTSPTIRPVLDLSQVSSGVNDLNSMISGNRSYELSARAKLDSDNAILEAQNGVTVNNKDVISTILSIRQDISNLSEQVGKMQVVMDTGALVGQISSPIDNLLGRKAYLRERGV